MMVDFKFDALCKQVFIHRLLKSGYIVGTHKDKVSEEDVVSFAVRACWAG